MNRLKDENDRYLKIIQSRPDRTVIPAGNRVEAPHSVAPRPGEGGPQGMPQRPGLPFRLGQPPGGPHSGASSPAGTSPYSQRCQPLPQHPHLAEHLRASQPQHGRPF
ncbi:hypothetical protein GGTG_06801 [Gaeumannomyces tritici R3-111a-1]|uniref:Uncharacterized protein n=1 Tax=Gaeumannomyces tritici (strain R3-111a-1) TaxID=644352 RepID=J3NZV4_GAET3|nr:hypothetical protein GGTG_06801 [Gaeumannomyces tritici R3-111a-1]EJT76887.1 hypothetical protein GGTG_06801 [Gaeumannomyces tritici R3-111a-1]